MRRSAFEGVSRTFVERTGVFKIQFSKAATDVKTFMQKLRSGSSTSAVEPAAIAASQLGTLPWSGLA